MDRQLFRLLTENSDEFFMLVDIDGKLHCANQAFDRRFVAKPKQDIYQYIEPKQHEQFKTYIKKCRASTNVIPASFRFKSAGTEYVRAVVRGRYYQNQRLLLVITYAEDYNRGFQRLTAKIATLDNEVRKHKHHEVVIGEHKQILDMAQKIAHIGSWRWLKDSRTIELSDEAKSLMGLTEQEESCPLELFFKALSWQSVTDFNDQLLDSLKHAGDESSVELQCRDAAGIDRIVELRATMIEVEGQCCYIGTLHDVTDIRQAEAELSKLNQQLASKVENKRFDLIHTNMELNKLIDKHKICEQLLVESEQAASISSLTMRMVQELDTPLEMSQTASQCLIDLMKSLKDVCVWNACNSACSDEFFQQAEYVLQILNKALSRTAELLDSINEVSADLNTDELRQINLKSSLQSVLLSLAPELKHGGVNVVVKIPDELTMVSMPSAYARIMTNLILNSVVHGFVAAKILAPKIIIEAESENNQIILKYQDNGVGMKREVLDKIYKPSYTENADELDCKVGLNAVYNIITNKMKGSIMCTSEPGHGTIFELKLPRNC